MRLAGVQIRTSAAADLIHALHALGAAITETGELRLADDSTVEIEQARNGEDTLIGVMIGCEDGSIWPLSLAS